MNQTLTMIEQKNVYNSLKYLLTASKLAIEFEFGTTSGLYLGYLKIVFLGKATELCKGKKLLVKCKIKPPGSSWCCSGKLS